MASSGLPNWLVLLPMWFVLGLPPMLIAGLGTYLGLQRSVHGKRGLLGLAAIAVSVAMLTMSIYLTVTGMWRTPIASWPVFGGGLVLLALGWGGLLSLLWSRWRLLTASLVILSAIPLGFVLYAGGLAVTCGAPGTACP